MTILLEPEASPDIPLANLYTADSDLRVHGKVNVLIGGVVHTHTIRRLTHWQVFTEEDWPGWWRNQPGHDRGEHVHHHQNRLLIR